MPDPAVPVATPQTEAFWEGTRQKRLMLQRSVETGAYFFYPRGFVPGEVDQTYEWTEVSGRGRLASFIINRRPLPGFENEPPVIALVELDEGPRMMTNIVDVDPSSPKLAVGARVEVRYQTRDAMTLPFFTIVEEKS